KVEYVLAFEVGFDDRAVAGRGEVKKFLAALLAKLHAVSAAGEFFTPGTDKFAVRVEFADAIARRRGVVDKDASVGRLAHAVRVAEFLAGGKFCPVVDHFIAMLIFSDQSGTCGRHGFFSRAKS